MLREAQGAGRRTVACTMDITDAFMTMKLDPMARRVSTFTTPIGKMR